MDRLSPLRLALGAVLEERRELSREETRALLNALLAPGDGTPLSEAQRLQLAALLGALAARGETVGELAGFVDSLRAHATPIPLEPAERLRLVDTCGTGGDLSGTFNISTAAALVAAAAGACVAKHGNRAVTSACGSADVLEALGIPVDHTPESAAQALREHGFAFLPAPVLQPAMKAVLPVRRGLGVRTAFNLLGPMSNPAGASAQVLGVYAGDKVRVVAETLALLHTRHAFVVHGGGLDEFTLAGPTTVAEVKGERVSLRSVTPGDFGLDPAPLDTLAGGDAAANAAILRSIFAGERGPRRDIVVMNAAAALLTAELAGDFVEGARIAQLAVDSGKVAALVAALAQG